jgi:hypothetical protein
MDVVDEVQRLGGFASRSQLPRRAVQQAVREGRLVPLGRTVVGLPDLPEATRWAVTVGGVLSCSSAAAVHGLPLLARRPSVHVTVPRGRSAIPACDGVVHRRDVVAVDGVTSLARTAADCARCLPELDGLVVVDAVLARGVDRDEVVSELRGPGSRAARKVVALADPGAGSSGETAARLAIQRAGWSVQPQVLISGVGWVDLLVEGRLVVEVDGFAYHSGAAQFATDRRRDAALVAQGYRVLRFTWLDAVTRPHYVVAMVGAALTVSA